MFNPNACTLAVLNITTYIGQCVDASHYYGNLYLISNPLLNTDNVLQQKLSGQIIPIKRILTEHEISQFALNEGFKPRKISERFETIDSLHAMGYEELRKLKLNVDFISLLNNEPFEQTLIMKKNQLNNNVGYKVCSAFGDIYNKICSYDEAIDSYHEALKKCSIPIMIRLDDRFRSEALVCDYSKVFDYLEEL